MKRTMKKIAWGRCTCQGENLGENCSNWRRDIQNEKSLADGRKQNGQADGKRLFVAFCEGPVRLPWE
eukprot:scaffold98632_cov20-Tisochrysis_lutea.AAC.1